MKNQRILLATLVGTLALGAWNSAEPSWAFDVVGEMKGVTTGVTEVATDEIIKQLQKAKDEAKAKLEKEMRAKLEDGLKAIDEKFEKKLKELKR